VTHQPHPVLIYLSNSEGNGPPAPFMPVFRVCLYFLVAIFLLCSAVYSSRNFNAFFSFAIDICKFLVIREHCSY